MQAKVSRITWDIKKPEIAEKRNEMRTVKSTVGSTMQKAYDF